MPSHALHRVHHRLPYELQSILHMYSGAMFKIDTGLQTRVSMMVPTKVLGQLPSPVGLPEILTVAHMRAIWHLIQCVSKAHPHMTHPKGLLNLVDVVLKGQYRAECHNPR